MTDRNVKVPNPRRVEAGRANRRKRGPLTPEGHQRLRDAALLNKPWKYSTGPKTKGGKLQVLKNAKLRQIGRKSIRELRQKLKDLTGLITELKGIRAEAQKSATANSGR